MTVVGMIGAVRPVWSPPCVGFHTNNFQFWKSFEDSATNAPPRRGAYIRRGYQPYRDVMSVYLQTFDAEDGRTVCARRTETVTPTQALYLMNHDLVEQVSSRLAEQLEKACAGNLPAAIRLESGQPLAHRPARRRKATSILACEWTEGQEFQVAIDCGHNVKTGPLSLYF